MDYGNEIQDIEIFWQYVNLLISICRKSALAAPILQIADVALKVQVKVIHIIKNNYIISGHFCNVVNKLLIAIKKYRIYNFFIHDLLKIRWPSK